MSTTQNSHFQTVISGIREQLENNKDLIQQADAVFVCGGPKTCLESTALLVGGMINSFKIEQAGKNAYTHHPPLAIVNSEKFTSDLIALCYNVGLPVGTRFTHINDYESSPVNALNTNLLLKRCTCVVAHDRIPESIIINTLHRKLINKELIGTYIQIERLDHEDEIKALQQKFSPTGLNVVFIETAKNETTGIIDLVFHTNR